MCPCHPKMLGRFARFCFHQLERCNLQLGCAVCALWAWLKRIAGWSQRKLNALLTDLGAETGILAISLMANRNLHPIERILWFIVFGLATFGAILLSASQIQRFINSPTVISVDRDYRFWHGALPAVTLCYYDHIDSFKANEYIQYNWNISIVDDEYFYFMDFLYAVVNATASNYADLARFSEDERFDDVNLAQVVSAIDRPFEQSLVSFNDGNSTIQVTPVMTERGFCYAINSPISQILTGKYGSILNWKKIDVHSPFEVSASKGNEIPLHKSDEITASYKVMETVASSNLRELSVEQRKCVFHDEETSQLKLYSKTLCLVRCRAVMALEMCNCVPFFYAFIEGPSCNPAGFECLLDFKWPIWALHICKCPSTCTEIEYTVQTVKKSSWGVKMNEESATSDAVTSSFRWDLIPPKVRMRRDVVFSFEDLLVSFGGALAFFVGFSLSSITRLGYVFAYHILLLIFEIFNGVLKRCFKVIKQLRFQYKETRFRNDAYKSTNRITSLTLRRKQLIPIHKKPSKDDILSRSCRANLK